MSRRDGRSRCSAAILALVLCAAAQGAEQYQADSHRPLPVRDELALAAVVQAALQRFPDAAELTARSGQAQAWHARSGSLLSQQPALTFRYQSDRWGNNDGLEEYEAGLSLPLWRWGERRAARSLAEALAHQASVAEAALRWQVAGLVRDRLWDMAEAEEAVTAASAAERIASRLSRSVERRHELGDVPLGDLLLARAGALSAREAVVDAQARLVDRQREFVVLTGLEARPSYRPEQQAEQGVIPATHPALALLRAELDGARARAAVTRQSARGTPTLTLGPRWERPPLGNVFEDSMGITMTLPLPGTAHAGTAVAEVQRDVAAAQARWDRLQRALELALHEAAHGLEVAQQNRGTAGERAEIARRHAALGLSAYEQGEMDLLDLLRLQDAAVAADAQDGRLRVEANRQIARYNQAVGDLP